MDTNTSRFPTTDRSRRRQDSWNRYHRRRRHALKLEAVRAKGGRCFDCGYSRSPAAVDLHHLDESTKAFATSGAVRAPTSWQAELEKCLLLCANCHRERHAARILARGIGRDVHPVVKWRRALKRRAVRELGGRCGRCGYAKITAVLEFHHRDRRTKEFSIAHDVIPRSWARVKNELKKCALLCANCHREAHGESPTDGV